MTTTALTPARSRTSTRALVVFCVVTFGLAWAVASPLWFGDGLRDPWFPLVAVAMMFTPAVGAIVATLAVERRRDVWAQLGIWPIRRPGRWVLFMLIGLVLPVIFILAALVTGALIGTYPADFAGAGGLVAIIEAQGVSLDGIPVAVLVASQFVGVLIGAFLNILPALGEEAGWRGWLVPRLLPRGPVVMIIVSGVLWGVWHAPLVLLGYNYPETPGWIAILSMTGMCTLVGAVFAWLRLRSDSVWPAALAHGSFNAAAGLSAVFAVAGSAVDPSSATILGWSGWIVPAGVVIVLLLTGAFRRPTAVPASDR